MHTKRVVKGNCSDNAPIKNFFVCQSKNLDVVFIPWKSEKPAQKLSTATVHDQIDHTKHSRSYT